MLCWIKTLINLQHISILNWYKKLILPFFSGQINCLVVFKFPPVYTEVVIVFFGVDHTPTILLPHVSPCHICFPIQNSSSILLSIFIAYLNRDPQRDSTLTTHGFLSWVAFFFIVPQLFLSFSEASVMPYIWISCFISLCCIFMSCCWLLIRQIKAETFSVDSSYGYELFKWQNTTYIWISK